MPLAAVDPALDHFARLGLPRRWSLDSGALQDAFVAQAREVHPDKYSDAPPNVQARARTHSSLINEAHHVLKDPLRRAVYLSKLAGFDLNGTGEAGGAPAPSQMFLLEMMERRDAAESLQDDAEREALLDEVLRERGVTFEGAVTALDTGDSASAAEALVVVRYLDRFVESLEEALDGV